MEYIILGKVHNIPVIHEKVRRPEKFRMDPDAVNPAVLCAVPV